MPKRPKIQSPDSPISASSFSSTSSSSSEESSNSNAVLIFRAPMLASQAVDITALRAFEEAHQKYINSYTIIGLNPKFVNLRHLITCPECFMNPLNSNDIMHALRLIYEFENISSAVFSMKRSFYDQRSLFTNQIATLFTQSTLNNIDLKLDETEMDRLQEHHEFEAQREMQLLLEENLRLRAELEETEAALKAAEDEIAQLKQAREFAPNILGGIFEATDRSGNKRVRFRQ